MQCPSSDDLAALVDRRLPAEAHDELQRHVAGCEACRARLSVQMRPITLTEPVAAAAPPVGGRVAGTSGWSYHLEGTIGRGGMGTV
jgi:hypothetical protein